MGLGDAAPWGGREITTDDADLVRLPFPLSDALDADGPAHLAAGRA